MAFTKLNDEVYVTDGDITTVTADDIEFLKQAAAANEGKKARLCAHPDVADPLHEMLIVHMGGACVPPHKHPEKSESFHIIEGRLKVVIYDDDGTVTRTIQMGEPGSGDAFFYRLAPDTFHTVVPETEFVVFHEVTNGPFDRKDMVIAPWASSESTEGK